MLKKMILRHKKIIVFLASMIALYILYNYFFKDFGSAKIRDYVDSYGVFAPIAYILLFSVLPIAFFPVPILALAGGLSFGLIDGTIYTIIGAMINSTIMFLLARFVARDTVSSYLRKKLPPRWKDKLELSSGKEGFYLLLVLRLIPLIPYNMINYVFGLTSMSFVSYSLATLLGIIPGTLVFLNIGDKAIDYKSPEFLISIFLLVALILVSGYFAKRINLESIKEEELGGE